MFNFLNKKLSTLIQKSLGSLLLIMIFSIASGCTHTSEIIKENQVDYFKEINSYDGGRTMTIYLTNGAKFETNMLTVTEDSTYFMNDDLKRLVAVKTSDIMEINQKYTGRGMVEGLGLGVSFGIITGGLIGLVIPADKRENNSLEDFGRNLFQPVVNVGTGISIGFFTGGILGLLAGSNGSPNSYIFKDNIELYQSRLLKLGKK